jgi:trehalose 6-phosphate synthase
LALLIAGSAVLSVAGYFVLAAQTRSWFEADLGMRSELAVRATERSLVADFGTSPERVRETLAAITRDERILGAAACTQQGETLVATESFPAEVSCASLRERMQATGARLLTLTPQLASGRVHLGIIALSNDGAPLGTIVLAHDLRYLEQREDTTRNLMLGAFFVMAFGASLLTLVAARFAWKAWVKELRLSLEGEPSQQFEPLVRDLHSLAERLASERDPEANEGLWSPDRLRATLTQYLHGERVVIVANREPYIHEHTDDGITVLHPASGLVSALEPVMRACSGVWIAHGSGSADRETVDEHDRILVPPGEESYSVRRVWLSEEEENGYYYGFANEGLWPLCHVADERPLFRTEDYDHYVKVNRKFADAVCQEVDTDDPIVLVQDYHFALAPKMIREQLPRSGLGSRFRSHPRQAGRRAWRR